MDNHVKYKRKSYLKNKTNSKRKKKEKKPYCTGGTINDAKLIRK